MATIRELRGRIKSINNIRQITRAMEMVATTKLRRFQDKAVASRPYSREITGLLARMAGLLGEETQGRPLFNAGAGTRIAVLLVSSDGGLCGPYNANVFKALEIWLRANPNRDVDYFVIGRKGFQYLTRRGRSIVSYLSDPPLEKVDYRAAARTSAILVEAFQSGKYERVVGFYTAFESAVKHVPTRMDFLPIQSVAPAPGEGQGAGGDLILVPDAQTIFDAIVPRYLETRIFNALLESITSEYASRRISMKNATDAARTMGNALRKIYNRKRQESITKELLDIVGGAEALR
ncbi:MAG: ATP synthase F1 subunit gamma [Planctomycetota bacterium]|nr:ATP synthase F1 subunit gamma [Planctomycetota bacterium]